MSVIEEISKLSKNGCDDDVLLNYIYEDHDGLECELNGDEFKEPKKHDRNLCIDCNVVPNVEYLSTILFMCNHTIIRCDIREGNAYIRDLTILRSY